MSPFLHRRQWMMIDDIDTGRELAHSAAEALTGLTERRVRLVEEFREDNARAQLCGDVIWYNPLWFGQIARRHGAEDVVAIMAHEFGHILDCSERGRADQERHADYMAGRLMAQMGYQAHTVMSLYRHVLNCSNCPPYQAGPQRAQDFNEGFVDGTRQRQLTRAHRRPQCPLHGYNCPLRR